MTQHTKTPWYVTSINDVDRRNYQVYSIHAPIYDAGGRKIDSIRICTELGFPGSVGGDTGQANAAFIVRACNSHDALVKALADITYAIEHGITSATMRECEGKPNSLLTQAKAALDAARGKE